ncbi:chemerin-like receptor 1 [Ambystoma mexicanum]|uniref:chemerin-like receptor 1 n=1 Tax=Ambystoma mexicanum TaxID=8296 RepID=UPI0037E7BB21
MNHEISSDVNAFDNRRNITYYSLDYLDYFLPYNDSEYHPIPDFPDEPDSSTSGSETSIRIFTVVFYSVICLLGILGNSLVIGISGFKMKKTVNTIWLLNLAIADFLFTFFLPLSIVYTALDFNWIFGVVMCKLNSFVMILNMFTSVLLLTIISLDRCISVILPVWSQNNRSPRRAYLICIGAWASAFLLSVPSLLFRDIGSRKGKTRCFNNYSLSANSKDLREKNHTATVLARFTFGFLIPVIIIIISYVTIALKLRRNRLAKSRRPFKMILIIIVAFFICWTPYHVLTIMEINHASFPESIFKVGMPIVTALATANSSMNPILYVFMGQDFRKFKMNILSRLEHALSEETIQSRVSHRSVSKMSSVNEKETGLL